MVSRFAFAICVKLRAPFIEDASKDRAAFSHLQLILLRPKLILYSLLVLEELLFQGLLSSGEQRMIWGQSTIRGVKKWIVCHLIIN